MLKNFFAQAEVDGADTNQLVQYYCNEIIIASGDNVILSASLSLWCSSQTRLYQYLQKALL